MSTENLEKLLASGQTDGVSMIVTVPAELWVKAQDEAKALIEDPNREIHENLGKSLLEAVKSLNETVTSAYFPVRHGRVQAKPITVKVYYGLSEIAPPPGRIYLYEPSEVEKLQRQVDDLIRVLARNAR